MKTDLCYNLYKIYLINNFGDEFPFSIVYLENIEDAEHFAATIARDKWKYRVEDITDNSPFEIVKE